MLIIFHFLTKLPFQLHHFKAILQNRGVLFIKYAKGDQYYNNYWFGQLKPLFNYEYIVFVVHCSSYMSIMYKDTSLPTCFVDLLDKVYKIQLSTFFKSYFCISTLQLTTPSSSYG